MKQILIDLAILDHLHNLTSRKDFQVQAMKELELKECIVPTIHLAPSNPSKLLCQWSPLR